ncbi:MAG: hypothetical protein Kow0042_30630 [Calditrichia bacterium]
MKNSLPRQGTSRIEMDILMEQLKKLSRKDRIIMGLCFYENLSVEETAEILGESTEYIKERLAKILPAMQSRKLSAQNESSALSWAVGG